MGRDVPRVDFSHSIWEEPDFVSAERARLCAVQLCTEPRIHDSVEDVEARNAQVPTLALATAPSDKCRVAHVPGCTRPTVKITHMQLRVGWDDDPQQRVYLRCLNCLNGWKRQARKALRLCPVYCTDPSFSALCMGCAGAELQGSRSLFMTPLLHRHGVETDAAEPGRCGGFRDTTCEKVSGCFPRSVCRL